MKNSNISTDTNSFKNILDITKHFPSEQSCRDYLEKTRWGNEIVCPHCSSKNASKFKNGKLYWCKDCKKQFTVKVGTIFEDSALPLQKWFMALYILTSHKKGISSLQLSKDISVTQKTAWFMLHRIRYAVQVKSFDKPLSGTIEVDETYIGGKHKGKRGRGSENKTPVFGMVVRGGEVRTMPVENVKRSTLHGIIEQHVKKGSTIMSDELPSYNGLSSKYTHERIGHLKKEYVRGGVHTQNIENFWSHMKRGIIGVYHQVSEKHLHRYTDEYAFRYNTRDSQEVSRFDLTLNRCEGRLTYDDLRNGGNLS